MQPDREKRLDQFFKYYRLLKYNDIIIRDVDLAKLLNVSSTYVYQLIKRKSTVSPEMLKKIESILIENGVDPSQSPPLEPIQSGNKEEVIKMLKNRNDFLERQVKDLMGMLKDMHSTNDKLVDEIRNRDDDGGIQKAFLVPKK